MFASLGSCRELGPKHYEKAASSRADLAAFLERVALIAEPNDGAANVLRVLGRLVTAWWLEGAVRVAVRGDTQATTIAIDCDVGFQVRDPLVPAVRLEVPFAEVAAAVKADPSLVAPLVATFHSVAILLRTAGTEPGEEDLVPDEDEPPISLEEEAGPHETVRRMVAITPEAIRQQIARKKRDA